MKETYEKYASLDAQIKVLEEQKEALKTEILSKMLENEEEKISTEFGNFTVTKLKKWTYPLEVVNKETDYKLAKSKAETDGTATFVENNSLRFSQAK